VSIDQTRKATIDSHSIMHAQPLQIAYQTTALMSLTLPTTLMARISYRERHDFDRRGRRHATSSDTSDCCEDCLLQPREGVALVPCGHSRFCGSCADTVASLNRGCPICRIPIRVVQRLYG